MKRQLLLMSVGLITSSAFADSAVVRQRMVVDDVATELGEAIRT